jgi:hypothetical protein
MGVVPTHASKAITANPISTGLTFVVKMTLNSGQQLDDANQPKRD